MGPEVIGGIVGVVLLLAYLGMKVLQRSLIKRGRAEAERDMAEGNVEKRKEVNEILSKYRSRDELDADAYKLLHPDD
jgi:hypothetical protein